MILSVTWGRVRWFTFSEVNQRSLKKKQHWRGDFRKVDISKDRRGQQTAKWSNILVLRQPLKILAGASLVAQCWRVHLPRPVQETRVQSLLQEDPMCRRATEPVCHNYWACVLEPGSCNYWAHEPQLLRSESSCSTREVTAMTLCITN